MSNQDEDPMFGKELRKTSTIWELIQKLMGRGDKLETNRPLVRLDATDPKNAEIRMGNGPTRVPFLKTSPRLPAGFLLARGKTGAGKSVTMAGLCAQLDLQETGVAGFMYVWEARAEPGFLTLASDGAAVEPYQFARLLSQALKGHKTEDLEDYGLGSWLGAHIVNKDPTNKDYVGVLFIDSLTLPLRSYSTTGSRSGESTMTGGMQPSDIAFCQFMQDVAVENQLCIIGLINEDLVPFADKLEGVIEGAINVTKAGSFQLRTRVNRTIESHELTPQALQAGMIFFGYKNVDEVEDADKLMKRGEDFTPIEIAGYRGYIDYVRTQGKKDISLPRAEPNPDIDNLD